MNLQPILRLVMPSVYLTYVITRTDEKILHRVHCSNFGFLLRSRICTKSAA